MNTLDLVYILGPYSLHHNKELELSLRSLERFVSGVRNIYVIGEHPGFNGNFIHIPATDEGRNKQDNIRRKFEIACRHPEISDPFVMMNDDYYFINYYDIRQIPYYFDKDLPSAYNRKRKKGHYKRALANTVTWLSSKGLPLNYYDIHMPVMYYKQAFLDVMAQYPWSSERDGFVIKSLYCNTLLVQGEQYPDCNILSALKSFDEIDSFVRGRFMFSAGATGFNEVLIRYLEKVLASPNISEVSEIIEK